MPEFEYTVGYKRPPLHTRFKPGHSGNRRGRPRKPKSLATYIKEALYRVVTVKVNGKLCRMPLIEAIVENLAHNAARGDARARRDLLGLTQRYPGSIRHQQPLVVIDETMSPREAAAAYAATLKAIPGLIDPGHEMAWDDDE